MSESKLLPEGEVRLYKQAAVISRYQGVLVAKWCGAMKKYFDHTYGDVWMNWQPGDVTDWYFQEPPMHAIAQEFIVKAREGGKEFLQAWDADWQKLRLALERLAEETRDLQLNGLSSGELLERYRNLLELHRAMWAKGIFIDSFDAGEDQQEIKRISAEHDLMREEVETLTAPDHPSYVAQWEWALWDVKCGRRSAADVAHEYFWIRTDYHYFAEVDEAYIEAEAAHAPQKSSSRKGPRVTAQQKENPLLLFVYLTRWRDERKRSSFVGLYALMRVLCEALRRQGIDPALARHLLPDDALSVFMQPLEPAKLKAAEARPTPETFLRVFEDGTYVYAEGQAAQAAYIELLRHQPRAETTELIGMVASKGRATGRVRVVAGPESPSAKLMQPGDILVTSMTRPEFVPLMKIAGAIVTDEGGISSHAAIVARELKKPCIIGTKFATQILHDGDMVEVDAERGIVTITKKASP